MIAICLPSRGLVFSKTMECVFEGMTTLGKIGIASSLHMAHETPIPQSHNICVESAMKNPDVERFFFIEEDNYLFPSTFVALATADFDVATVQYNDKNGSPFGIIHKNEAGEILWGGVGSTVIKRKVFETLGEPYFRTDTLYRNIKNKKVNGVMVTDYEEVPKRQEYNEEKGIFEDAKDEYKYGGLDIDLYTRARKAGFTIGALDTHKGHHFELVALGEKHTNNGFHTIRQV